MVRTLGTVERPLLSTEPMKIARDFVLDLFTVDGKRGLWWSRGDFLVWTKGRWESRGAGDLFMEAWRWLEDAYHVTGDSQVQRYAPVTTEVNEVIEAMKAICELPWKDLPAWVENRDKLPDPSRCIAFEDVVVGVQRNGELVCVPRDVNWLDTVVLPVPYNPDAACPTWDKCLNDWGDGDPEWRRLLGWIFAYACMSNRSYAKWPLLQGVSRGGKGVVCKVLARLLGKQGYMGVSVRDFAESLDGFQYPRVLCVNEVERMDKGDGQRAARFMKNVLGGDPMSINIKYQRPLRGVVVRAMPMLVSNSIPALPNENGGLGSKMVVLPFTQSWLGKEDFDLQEKLEAELEGIGAWVVRHACEMEACGGKPWPVPVGAHEKEEEFRLENNPWEAFLETYFFKNADGFVSNEVLWSHWCEYRAATEAPRVARNSFIGSLVNGCTWRLARQRDRADQGQVRGLRGLSLRVTPKTDL